MDRISSIPFPTNAAQAARAYGARPVAPVSPASPIRPDQPAQRTEPVGRIGITGPTAAPAPARAIASDPGRLVAAQVEPIDLARDVATITGRPAEGSLPMYRHPADRNQAATAVALGRALDLKA